MKARLLAVVCTLSLTLCAASTPAAAQYATNVVLEGPWILYVDTALIKAHPVLVAVSPGGVYDPTNTNMNMFHTPWLSAGDGYPVGTPNIYCLHWGDEKCAPTVSAATSLTSAISPEKAPLLSMNAAQHGQIWSWASKTGITAFILPMPDSYSTVAGWYMRFAPKWDGSGNTYNPYPLGADRHSIGIELHYKNGPSYSDSGISYFSLDKCVVNSGVLGTCSDAGGDVGHVTKLDNVGTLNITMKSPTTDACDPHVRMAYPKVIGLLDGDNHLYQAIDTAKSTYPSGAAEYDEPADNPRCLDKYPTTPMDAQIKTEQMPYGVSLWTGQLGQFSSQISAYLQQEGDPEGKNTEDKKLLLTQIKTAIDNLNKDFPRFSQMRLILMLLEQSEEQAEFTPGVIAKPPAFQNRNYWSNLLNAPLTLPNLAKLDGYFRATAPLTKSGNDCNAPLILATTP